MNEQDDEVAHPGNGNNTSQATVFRPNWQFAIDTLQERMRKLIEQQKVHIAGAEYQLHSGEVVWLDS